MSAVSIEQVTQSSAIPRIEDDNLSPDDVFHHFFEVKVVSDRADVALCQQIRYQVYCIEHGWGAEVTSTDGREYDEFDERSVHVLLSYRPTSEPVGTVRLVKPLDGREYPELPIQEIEPNPLLLVSDSPLPRMGEVSRFAVAKKFRRRPEELSYPDVGWRYEPTRIHDMLRRALPNISIGLMRGIFMAAQEHGIGHLCATMEPTLLKLLARMGIMFSPLGPLQEYHGLRQPCYLAIADVKRTMRHRRPELYPIVFDV